MESAMALLDWLDQIQPLGSEWGKAHTAFNGNSNTIRNTIFGRSLGATASGNFRHGNCADVQEAAYPCGEQ